MSDFASKTSRSPIVFLLPAVLLAAGCDRGSPEPVQANRTATDPANTISADEASADRASADEAPPTPGAGTVRPDYSHAGERAPSAVFTDAVGKPTTLAAFRGKPLLVNLWATWCAPCVAELPTLNALAKREQGQVTVVAISQDTDAGKAKAFWAKHGLSNLTLYTDPDVKLSVAYAANLPTTVLYDAAGKEVVRVTGGMDWAGTDAAGLLAKAR